MQNHTDNDGSTNIIVKILQERLRKEEKLKKEYNDKLSKLLQLINLINENNQMEEGNNSYILDNKLLDQVLINGIEVIVRNGQEYALIPLKQNKQELHDEKRKKKKKKNKILCSYCNKMGHTRSKCEARLLNLK